MERDQLEHVLRASAAITNCRDFVIIGSQAALGEHPDAPAALKASREVDIYPLDVPELADLIDGSIGEGSVFESPATGGLVGRCIDTHDLAISKFVANREKDRSFNAGLIGAGLIDKATTLRRCDLLDDSQLMALVRSRIERAFGEALSA